MLIQGNHSRSCSVLLVPVLLYASLTWKTKIKQHVSKHSLLIQMQALCQVSSLAPSLYSIPCADSKVRQFEMRPNTSTSLFHWMFLPFWFLLSLSPIHNLGELVKFVCLLVCKIVLTILNERKICGKTPRFVFKDEPGRVRFGGHLYSHRLRGACRGRVSFTPGFSLSQKQPTIHLPSRLFLSNYLK